MGWKITSDRCMPDQIRANLDKLQQRVDQACIEAGRDPAEVKVLLATKTVPADQVAVAVEHGYRLIGENRVQELAEKDNVLATLDCERHFIGRLQTNKINHVLKYVTCVQSVDRLDIADRLQRRLETIDHAPLDVFLQVNTSAEDSKGGAAPDDAAALAKEVARRDRLRLKGLMTIGLPSPEPQEVRASYRKLREIRDDIGGGGIQSNALTELSMGMSGDYSLAIAEGATMIRLGSAIFGSRH